MDLCSLESESILSEKKIHDFLFNKEKDALTGPRRMGRENLVNTVSEQAECMGLNVSVFPDISGIDAVFFYEQKQIVPVGGNADILFGQDLCHQVPAIVRLKD